MRIITRYLLREIAGFFLICLFTFSAILLTMRMLKLASLVINKGVSFSQVVTVFVAIVPAFLELAIPLAVLLGVMLAFNRLSGDSEIIVFRSSGISIFRLIRPVALFGAVVAALNVYVSFEMRPWGFQRLSQILFEISQSRSTAGLNAGIFNDLGNLTLYAQEIDDKTGLLSGVLIDDRREEASRKIITAKHGKIAPQPSSRSITLGLAGGLIHEQVEGKYYITDYNTNSIVLDPNELQETEAAQEDRMNRELSLHDLRIRGAGLLAAIETAPKTVTFETGVEPTEKPLPTRAELTLSRNRVRLEIGRRYAMPAASFILALIGMALGILPPRTQKTWGAGFSAALGMSVFVAYYALLSIGMALGESGVINPYFSVWLPNIMGLLIAVYLHSQMGRERWQSIAQGIEEFLRYMVSRARSVMGAA